MKQFSFTAGWLLVFCFISSWSWAADGEALFMEMAKKLAEADQFAVSMFMSYDAVQESGEKIEFREQRDIIIRRPDHLRNVALQSDGDKNLLVADGETITLYSESENVYCRISHAGTVDEQVRYAGGNLGIRIPLARMLLSTLPVELEKLNFKAQYVEKDILSSPPSDHVFARSDDVDCQLWITKDKLPIRIVLTYKNEPGQPQFRADFTNWNMTPVITETTFSFTPPEGAEKIPALLPEEFLRQEKMKKEAADDEL
jgi:hypothetical protein